MNWATYWALHDARVLCHHQCANQGKSLVGLDPPPHAANHFIAQGGPGSVNAHSVIEKYVCPYKYMSTSLCKRFDFPKLLHPDALQLWKCLLDKESKLPVVILGLWWMAHSTVDPVMQLLQSANTGRQSLG